MVNKKYWDNFDEELYEEFVRQKLIARFKKEQLIKQIKLN